MRFNLSPVQECEIISNQYGSSEEGFDLDQIIGDIGKYLPCGCAPSHSALMAAADRIADNLSTPAEEALRLSSKKIIKRK